MKLTPNSNNCYLSYIKKYHEHYPKQLPQTYNVKQAQITFPKKKGFRGVIPKDVDKKIVWFQIITNYDYKNPVNKWVWYNQELFSSCMSRLLTEGDKFVPQNKYEKLAFQLIQSQK